MSLKKMFFPPNNDGAIDFYLSLFLNVDLMKILTFSPKPQSVPWADVFYGFTNGSGISWDLLSVVLRQGRGHSTYFTSNNKEPSAFWAALAVSPV